MQLHDSIVKSDWTTYYPRQSAWLLANVNWDLNDLPNYHLRFDGFLQHMLDSLEQEGHYELSRKYTHNNRPNVIHHGMHKCIVIDPMHKVLHYDYHDENYKTYREILHCNWIQEFTIRTSWHDDVPMVFDEEGMLNAQGAFKIGGMVDASGNEQEGQAFYNRAIVLLDSFGCSEKETYNHLLENITWGELMVNKMSKKAYYRYVKEKHIN